MKVNFYTPFLLLLCFCYPAVAQKLTNVRATIDSATNTVNILYDLQGAMEGQLYQVNLYSSHNNFSSPLSFVNGDVGDGITPGTDKQIVWQPKELLNFNGQL